MQKAAEDRKRVAEEEALIKKGEIAKRITKLVLDGLSQGSDWLYCVSLFCVCIPMFPLLYVFQWLGLEVMEQLHTQLVECFSFSMCDTCMFPFLQGSIQINFAEKKAHHRNFT